MANYELLSFKTSDELASSAASAWLDEVESASNAEKPHRVALSGGRIAHKFFTEVAAQNKARTVPFKHVHFFWADERCVPPSDPESNFKLANELLFAPLKISENQIHRIRGELPPETAATQAASDIFQSVTKNAAGQPILNLIFLGMGEDGHVASLFPGKTEGTNPKEVFFAVKNSPKPPSNRISLSYAAITAARQVWVLASGAGKVAALRESLASDGKTPLAKVIQSRQQTKIFTDFPLG